LEDHRHLTPVGRHRARWRGEDLAVHLDRTERRLDKAGDHPQSCRLAAPRRPEQRDELPGLQFEVDVVDRMKIAVMSADAGQLEPAQLFLRSMKSRPMIFVPMTAIATVASRRITPSAARTSKLPSSDRSNSITEMTRVCGPTRKIAEDNSRVAGVKTRIQAPARLFSSSGIRTLRIARKRLPPRIRTASSISGLMLRSPAALDV